jgi:4-amino-4-deoxy-L-arabinose transferase-like glycosyltransferase
MSSTAPALLRRRLAGAAPRPRRQPLTRTADPRWVRPALLGVLALSAVLVLWGLTRSGDSNTYYAAAVKSASESWKAWFFGSLDPGSFITVDKPPLSIWLMGLSARIFGFSSLSMLLPEALCTIAAVGLLFATVRRVFGPAAGILAAAALAITPITVAIGRVNNPDALLVLLLVASAWMLVRALESGRTKHLLLCGAIVGLAFMTKMLQGWMVVPALAAAYAIAGPPRLLVRLGQLAAAGLAMVVASAAWPAAVTLWPGSAPYIGGSTNGSVWQLIFGYNGFGRLFGEGGLGSGASFGGQAGSWRMFNEQVGGQIAWLLPLAGIALVAGLWLTRSAQRTDLRRAGWVLFGLWALVHVAVFSSQQGIFHPYYVSALAPAVAALAGAGAVTLWRWAARSWTGLTVLDVAILATAWVSVALLQRTPSFAPALHTLIPVAAAVAVCASVALRVPGVLGRRGAAVGAVAAVLALAAGPAAYSVVTAGRALDGNNVTAGPASASTGGPGRGGGLAGRGSLPGGDSQPAVGSLPSGGGFRAAGGGPRGGSLSATTLAYLKAHQGSAKYLVAATGSQTTAGIILATGEPVVTIGGFSGQDPAPTVSQLSAMVARGELRYVLVSSGGMGGPGASSSHSALTTWVEQHGTAVKNAGVTGGTLYEVQA